MVEEVDTYLYQEHLSLRLSLLIDKPYVVRTAGDMAVGLRVIGGYDLLTHNAVAAMLGCDDDAIR